MRKKYLLTFVATVASLAFVVPIFASQRYLAVFLLSFGSRSSGARILLYNPAKEHAAVTLRSHSESGNLLGQSLVTLGPSERKIFLAGSQEALPEETATVQAESDTPVIGLTVFGSLEKPLEVLPASAAASLMLDFPYFSEGNDSWATYELFNPNAASVRVSFRAFDKNGGLLAEVPLIPLFPLETRTILIEDVINNSLLPFVATVRIVADSPLIGHEILGSFLRADIVALPGRSSPDAQLFFPVITKGGNDTELGVSVRLLNSSTNPTSFTVKAFDAAGISLGVVVDAFPLAPMASASLETENLGGSLPAETNFLEILSSQPLSGYAVLRTIHGGGFTWLPRIDEFDLVGTEDGSILAAIPSLYRGREAQQRSGSLRADYWQQRVESLAATGPLFRENGDLRESRKLRTAIQQSALDSCQQYSAFFEEASGRYHIPSNLLRAVAIAESHCNQGIPNWNGDGGCGVMQLTGETKTGAAALLQVSESALCDNTSQGARLNILGGAAVLDSYKCWANPRILRKEQFYECQGNRNYILTNSEKQQLAETLEVWWWPVAQYNGGGRDGFIASQNYPFRVWKEFSNLNINISYPPLYRVEYFLRGEPAPGVPGKSVDYYPYELSSTDDNLYPKPSELGRTGITGGIRWTNGSFNPFQEITLHRNDGAVSNGSVVPAGLLSPVPGSILTSSTVTFSWSSGTGVTQYWLYIGSTLGGSDLFNQNQGTQRSVTVSGLPTDGRTLHVRLWSFIGGAWQFRDYTFVTATSSFNASGRVTTSSGTGVSGATMTFSRVSGVGTIPAAIQTDANGNWSQSGFRSGTTYRVTPSKSSYTFTPTSRDFSSPSTGLNFTGTTTTGCTASSISIGQTLSGVLSTSDCRSPVRGNSFYADRYSFNASAGQQVAVLLTSTASDTYLYLINPSGSVIAQDDDGGGGANSRIPASSGFYSLPSSGTYIIEVTSYAANTTGSYTLSLSTNSNTVIFQDNMENGSGSWFAQSPWALTTSAAYSPTRSWTDSPGGNYSNNANVALWSPFLNFSGLSSVTLTFWHRYDLESGYDFGRVWITTDNGSIFTQVASFTGINTTWTQTSIDLSAFAGRPSVRIVFQLFSDGSVTRDGWYIDNVLATGR